jgi:hypothetical protein
MSEGCVEGLFLNHGYKKDSLHWNEEDAWVCPLITIQSK